MRASSEKERVRKLWKNSICLFHSGCFLFERKNARFFFFLSTARSTFFSRNIIDNDDLFDDNSIT